MAQVEDAAMQEWQLSDKGAISPKVCPVQRIGNKIDEYADETFTETD